MDSIEPEFSGAMLLKLKKGCKEYVSRIYLPAFKKYLGLQSEKEYAPHIWKALAKSTAVSIGISMTIFCFIGMTFDIIHGESFSLENYQFTKMVLGCIIVGF